MLCCMQREKLMISYDYSESRDVYSHEMYNKFDFEDFDDAQCNTEFRFVKNDIQRLADALQLPQKLFAPKEQWVRTLKVFAFC